MRFNLRCLLSAAALLAVFFTAGGAEADTASVREAFVPLAEHLSGGDVAMMPLCCSEIEVITSGERKWELLLSDIKNARKSIYMEYYRWADDDAGRQIRDALLEKLREGLDVKVLVEDICNPFYRKDYYLDMRRAGMQIAFFTDTDRQLWEILPGIRYRDHRKIVIIDGEIGYTGGMNLADHYLNLWRDTHIRVKGAAVDQLSRMFADMWASRRGPEQNAGIRAVQAPAIAPASTEDPVIEKAASCKKVQFATSGAGDTLLQDAVCKVLDAAKDYVYLQTPYFCPTEAVLKALTDAALRGVDVRLVIPEDNDVPLMESANRSFYGDCLKSGIRVYEYTERFNHSKVIVCDDYLSIIGSLNLDSRSLCINYEVIAAVYDPEVALLCRDDFDYLTSKSSELTLSDVESWNRTEKSAQRFWRRHSSLL